MVKPKGTTGATKMKILAIIDHNCNQGYDSYGYTIWQSLKNHFYIYMSDSDVRNVYHHLKELTELGYLNRDGSLVEDPMKRCLYTITENGRDLANRYSPYLDIVRKSAGPGRKY